MKLFNLIILLALFLSACANQEERPTDYDRAEILRLHELQRKCHFEKMKSTFADMLSDSFISVNRGEITRPTREENMVRFGNYFNSVNFHKWDDMTRPVIRFSDDGSLAYTVVDKDVVVSYLTDEEEMLFDKTEFAWVSIYKKYPDGWKIDCVASTNKETEIIEPD